MAQDCYAALAAGVFQCTGGPFDVGGASCCEHLILTLNGEVQTVNLMGSTTKVTPEVLQKPA